MGKVMFVGLCLHRYICHLGNKLFVVIFCHLVSSLSLIFYLQAVGLVVDSVKVVM